MIYNSKYYYTKGFVKITFIRGTVYSPELGVKSSAKTMMSSLNYFLVCIGNEHILYFIYLFIYSFSLAFETTVLIYYFF